MKLLKGLSVIFYLFFYFCGALSITLLIPLSTRQRKMLIQWMHRCSRLLLDILDVQYWVDFRTRDDSNPGTLFLANHVSYLDVLILASQYPAVFVTSIEVRNSFFLGWLARLSGAYFVERRNRGTLKKDVLEIRKILQQGLHVVLFPEGTTSDGTLVLPFKAALLEAIVKTEIEVKPICLNYRWCDGEMVTAKHKKTLFYFGEMNLWKQLGTLLGASQILTELIILPPLPSHFKRCRTEAAKTSRAFITAVFRPITAAFILGLWIQGAAMGQGGAKALIADGDRAFEKRNMRSELSLALENYSRARKQPHLFIEASWKYAMALQSFASRFVQGEANQAELFKEGADVAKAAAEQDPECGPCEFWTAIHMAQYGERVGVFKMLGSLSEILSRLEKAAALDPTHAMAGPYRVLGTIYHTLPGIIGGDNDKALSYFEKAIASNPHEPINYLALAKLKISEGETELAKRFAQRGIHLANGAPISLESRESLLELEQMIQ